MAEQHTGTQAVDRAAALLLAVLRATEPPSFSALVDGAGLPKSTVSRLVSALERNDLVERSQEGTFTAGQALREYARRGGSESDLITTAMPYLRRIGEATGETVNLAVPRNGSAAQIAQVDSRYMLGGTNWVGMRVPLHCSGVGKVFLAFGAAVLPKGRLERRTSRTIIDRMALGEDLARVVRRGFAVTDEELEPGLVAIAAPVRGMTGTVVAALSVSGPSARLSGDRIVRAGQLLKAEAARLSAALGDDSEMTRQEGVA
jgi:IclR family transcriptional regulator, acetate operon repressor